MGDKPKYRSALRSKRMIRDAFIELIKEKDVSKITVTDIVNRADINRTTFYAHYPDVRGVMEEFENETVDRLMDVLSDIKDETFFQHPLPVLLKTNRYLEEDLDFYRTLMLANGSDTFLEKFQNVFIHYMNNDTNISESIRNSAMFKMRVYFFAGGIINMYKKWFKGELTAPLNTLAVELGKIITLSSKDFI